VPQLQANSNPYPASQDSLKRDDQPQPAQVIGVSVMIEQVCVRTVWRMRYCDDIIDIIQVRMYGIEHLKSSIKSFILGIIMQKNATPMNNPLLFWVGRILQTEEFEDFSRLGFADLKDELTMYLRKIGSDLALCTFLHHYCCLLM
jgi:hypothetical protein